MNYYLVETPEVSFSWIGGPTRPAGPGKVWLTNPDGTPVLEIEASCVRRTTREETAKRIEADRRANKAPMPNP